MVAFSTTISSCASFFGGESGALITDISSKQDESGNTIITVEFDSDEYAPVEVTIPKGVGIDRIEHSLNGDTSVNLKIYYTDQNMSPTELSLPIIKGNDGKGVSNITCEQKEDGNYELIFEMTDGTKFGPFPIQKGEDAKNIVKVEATTDEETGYTTITLTFDDETTLSANIKLGKDGRGIEYIETLSDIGNNYVIRVHYSDGTSEEVAKDVAMHVAAMNPTAINREGVPSDVVERESHVIKEQVMGEGKPADIAEKMVVGRLNKFYKEVCLEEQAFIKDSNVNVLNYVKNNGGSIVSMIRYAVGEGIEKRQENFADEVMSQVKGA